jgi:hypothetical protein
MFQGAFASIPYTTLEVFQLAAWMSQKIKKKKTEIFGTCPKKVQNFGSFQKPHWWLCFLFFRNLTWNKRQLRYRHNFEAFLLTQIQSTVKYLFNFQKRVLNNHFLMFSNLCPPLKLKLAQLFIIAYESGQVRGEITSIWIISDRFWNIVSFGKSTFFEFWIADTFSIWDPGLPYSLLPHGCDFANQD